MSVTSMRNRNECSIFLVKSQKTIDWADRQCQKCNQCRDKRAMDEDHIRTGYNAYVYSQHFLTKETKAEFCASETIQTFMHPRHHLTIAPRFILRMSKELNL